MMDDLLCNAVVVCGVINDNSKCGVGSELDSSVVGEILEIVGLLYSQQ